VEADESTSGTSFSTLPSVLREGAKGLAGESASECRDAALDA
jgi:hypothetical protein